MVPIRVLSKYIYGFILPNFVPSVMACYKHIVDDFRFDMFEILPLGENSKKRNFIAKQDWDPRYNRGMEGLDLKIVGRISTH
jgi:hypothetical protein